MDRKPREFWIDLINASHRYEDTCSYEAWTTPLNPEFEHCKVREVVEGEISTDEMRVLYQAKLEAKDKEIARLLNENSGLATNQCMKDGIIGDDGGHPRCPLEYPVNKIERLTARIKELEMALHNFGEHDSGCKKFTNESNCNCGLARIISGEPRNIL